MPNTKLFITAIVCMALLLFFNSCEIINTDEPIPSYIYVDSFSVETSLAEQGSDNQNIYDIWAVHNGLIVATVPIPCTIPIIQEKGNEVILYPGIKENGTSTNRSIYPFFEPVVVNIDFEDGKIYNLYAKDVVFKYKSSVKFLWLEGFENETIGVQPVNDQSASIQRTKNPSKVLEGNASLLIELTEKEGVMSIQSFDFFPGKEFNAGSPAFLEINYKNEVNMQIGFAYRSIDNLIQYDQPSLYLKESENIWKKVYVKMTDEVGHLADEAGIKIYFAAVLPTGTTNAEILIDNIKLLTFE